MTSPASEEPQARAAGRIRQAAAATKCWSCGCLHDTIRAVERGVLPGGRLPLLDEALEAARRSLRDARYDCLGCDECFPALAVNDLNEGLGEDTIALAACPAEEAAPREGWPPLPGSYVALRYHAPVAVCTLGDEALRASLAAAEGDDLAIVGTLATENLGIERLIRNVLANPNLRSLIVCGVDTQRAVGHFPGQSLVALARNGLDERGRIAGAKGKRPLLKNLELEAVRRFRDDVEVVDLVGVTEPDRILEAVRGCAARSPGPRAPFAAAAALEPIRGGLPDRMTPDPAGYFVVYVDRRRGVLSLEHYEAGGLMDRVIEGATAAEVYSPAIALGLLTRLDHAAYLGRELARAERALRTGEPFVQDRAPERETGCEPRSCCG